ncbi:hypothetical protein TNCV_4385801 [Trichonephila clavipes]|nr:hypothetical protein TNCV_4385801 [Trichonephila clavipes]
MGQLQTYKAPSQYGGYDTRHVIEGAREGRGKKVLPRKSQAVQDVIWRGLLSLALGAKSLPASTKGKTLYVATFQSRDCSLRGSAPYK